MKKSKSHYTQIVRDFLITLLVPLVAMVLLAGQAETTMKEQLVKSNKNILEQFFELVDSEISNMEKTGYTVLNQDKLRLYSLYAETGNRSMTYQIVGIMDLLEKTANDNYYDLFAYFPANSRVISGKFGSLELETYCKINYGGKETQELWEQILSCNTAGASLYTIRREGNPDLLCVAMRKKFIGNHDRDYVLVQIISPDYLKSIMTKMCHADEGILLLFNADKELLISGDGKTGYNMSVYDGEEYPFEIELNDGLYMIQVEPSSEFDGYYAIAINYDAFWEQLTELRWFCFIGILACAVLSIIVAVRGSKRSYRPFVSIINRMEERNQSRYDASLLSEVDFVNQLYEKEISERISFERKEKSVALNDFIVSLLSGDINTESAENSFSEKGIALLSERFCVILMDINRNPEMKSDLEGFAVKNVFEELAGHNGKGYIVRTTKSQYACLLNVGQLTTAEIISESFIQGRDFLKQHLELGATISVGDIHDGMSGILKSYEEANAAMRYKFLLGEGTCILYNQIKVREFQYLPALDSKLSRLVQLYLQKATQADFANKLVEELFDMYGIDERAAMETVECFKHELLCTISKAVISQKSVFPDYRDLIEDMFSQTTLVLFKAKVVNILSQLWLAGRERIEGEDICSRAQAYIRSHYQEPEISLNTLAEKMRISPSYLSKLFKEKYNISVLDYIAKIRVDNAKTELRNSSKTIKQIAHENGFLSSTVFINTFKKYEGITPGKYRNVE